MIKNFIIAAASIILFCIFGFVVFELKAESAEVLVPVIVGGAGIYLLYTVLTGLKQ